MSEDVLIEMADEYDVRIDPSFAEKATIFDPANYDIIGLKYDRKYATRKLALELENHLHDFYSHKRVRGEWFDLNAKEVDEIIKLLSDLLPELDLEV